MKSPLSSLRLTIVYRLALAFSATCELSSFATEDGQTNIKFLSAKNYVETFEAEVKRAEGKPVGETYAKREAMRRVAELMKEFPDDPRVVDFKSRLRDAIMGGKGDTVVITEEMLAYLKTEYEALEVVSSAGSKKWAEILHEQYDDFDHVVPAFPAVDPESVDVDDQIGARLLLSGFDYESNVFSNGGKQWVAVGSASQGFYFVDTSSSRFVQCREAVKRARSQALGSLSPEASSSWLILGEVTGVNLLVPGGGENTALQAYTGWEVEPLAVWVPGTLTAYPTADQKGSYAGEEELMKAQEKARKPQTVPVDVTPADLVRLHLAAIKEKNEKLYLETIHPQLREGPRALSHLQFVYDVTLRRLHTTFVHAEPFEVGPVVTLEGEPTGDEDLEKLFLDDQDQAANKALESRHVEGVLVRVKRYDAKGRQVESVHRMALERSPDVEGNRWFLVRGYGF
ncbi:MAG: hypothetical protein KDK97_02110 [Verrucomicrobiales bacterium]|nr:hypothetical protein [Verrucomicrobiales bacterium]MCP5558637.1 hypothetical protein [Verrucomicrobiaceae bacterium]